MYYLLNNKRPHSSIDYLSPMEYINKYKSKNEKSFPKIM